MTGSHALSDPESEAEVHNDDDGFIDMAQTASPEILQANKDTRTDYCDIWRVIK